MQTQQFSTFDEYESRRKENRNEVILALLGTVGLQILAVILILTMRTLINYFTPDYLQTFTHVWEQMYVYYAIFLIMIVFLYATNMLKPLLQTFKKAESYAHGIKYGVIVIAASIMYSLLVEQIFGSVSVNENQEVVVTIIKQSPLISFIWIPFIGPLVEELTYRRGLYARLRKINVHIALVLTSVIFGLIHFNFPFTENGIDYAALRVELINLPNYIISGFIFSYAYEKHGFGASSVAHIFNNLFAFVGTLLI